MTRDSVRLRPYGTIFGAVLTRARLPIARIFGEIPAAKELGLVFVPASQSQRAKGAADLGDHSSPRNIRIDSVARALLHYVHE